MPQSKSSNEINKLNENTENVNEVSRTHIPLEALMNDDSTLKGGMFLINSTKLQTCTLKLEKLEFYT